jgi:hypothetical protein
MSSFRKSFFIFPVFIFVIIYEILQNAFCHQSGRIYINFSIFNFYGLISIYEVFCLQLGSLVGEEG